jgi:hypothetical protein
MALVMPVGLLALSLAWHRPDAVYERFLAIFMDGVGASPLFLTLVAVAWFYAFAASRGVPRAWEALTASLAAFTVVGPHTLDLDGLVTPRTWPLLAVAGVQLGLLRHCRESWRGLVAASCIAVASRAGLADWPAFERDALTFHVVLAAALLIGTAFDDPIGRRLRRAGAVLLTLAGLVAIVGDPIHGRDLPPTIAPAYLLAVIATGLAFGYLVGCRAYVASAAAVSGTWLASAGWRGYILLRQLVVGLDLIAWGLVFFLLAALISLAKGGVLRRRRWVPHGAPPERVGSP